MFLPIYMVTVFDLLLLHGLIVCNFAIDDQTTSVHKPVTFRVSTSFHITRPTKAVSWSRTITPSPCTEFSAVFKEISQSSDLLCDDWSGADYHNHINMISAKVLNSLAVIISKQHKAKAEPDTVLR